MTDFLRRLPAPSSLCVNSSLGSFSFEADIQKSTNSLSSFNNSNPQLSSSKPLNKSQIPPYGNRTGWSPKTLEDFQDGGAFPEIPVVQYPANMGKHKTMSEKTVALQIGEDGDLEYDKITKFNNERTIVYSKAYDQIAKYKSVEKLNKPPQEKEKEEVEIAKAAIQETLTFKTNKDIIQSNKEKKPEFFKYTPNQQSAGHNSNCAQRVIRMVDLSSDPLDVAKFKHKRIPRAPPSPPPPLQHSPPRKLTQKDQQDWNVPPCVSNWKNQKGYTIPLDKRIHADGRGLHDVTINDKFAAMSEALYIAERSAREDIRMRNELMKKKKAMEEEIREQQLRQLAAKARAERSNIINTANPPASDETSSLAPKKNKESFEEFVALQQRQYLEKERKREIEREFRLEKAGKRNKLNRDEDRDISERIALGQAQPTSQQLLYDARLFNQTAGVDSGYDGLNDESYGIYDKPLFADRAKVGLYTFESERFKQSIGSSMTNIPAFSGAQSRGQRSAPVEFEKDVADPFGLDNLLSEAKKK